MATKKRKYYVGDIPFDCFGNLLHYPYQHFHHLKPENLRNNEIWISQGYPATFKKVVYSDKELAVEIYSTPKTVSTWDNTLYIGQCKSGVTIPNYNFKDKLKISGHSRGRSAIYFHFTSLTTERTYTCFIKDFEEFFVNRMVKGEIEDNFTFCKRGGNYGITVV